MSKNKTILCAVVGTLLIVFIFGIIFYFKATPSGKAQWNTYFHKVQTADDVTNYDTIKSVEDTCRAMISSYYADKLAYEQYMNSDSEEKRSWSEQAKMRANKTAATYNNYVLKNRYVWKNNVPPDIKMELEAVK